MDDQVELLQRRLTRERVARKQAEQIIEEKSRELYFKGQDLARTAEAERQARNEAETMLQALETFTSGLDHDEIVVHLEGFIQSLIPHDSHAIYFFDGEDLRLHSVWGDLKEQKVVGEILAPTALLSEIMQVSRPILIVDASHDAMASEWGIHAETETWMAVPMSAHGRNIGCLTLESRERAAFDESAIRLVQALANEAVIALENARLFREVQKLSTIDPLTGLYNRRHFNASAQLEFQRTLRCDLPLSVIMMDIDHFKRVNDTYGHAAGDRVLVLVAAACMQRLRSMDLHARYGGEEFCFLLPETTPEGAVSLAERLRSAIAALHFDSDKGSFTLTASFGVAECLASEDSVDHLLERSDQALYEAKRGGRNRVILWTLS
ncbi:MAG: sensor domain-containing diguanylate cyclase [bacterium]